MAFELNPEGGLTFTRDDAEFLRQKYRTDPTVENQLAQITGSPDMAKAILAGPSQKDIDHLREFPDAAPKFDAVWGVGAAAYHKDHHNVWEHLREIPGQALGGATEAVGETANFLARQFTQGNTELRRVRDRIQWGNGEDPAAFTADRTEEYRRWSESAREERKRYLLEERDTLERNIRGFSPEDLKVNLARNAADLLALGEGGQSPLSDEEKRMEARQAGVAILTASPVLDAVAPEAAQSVRDAMTVDLPETVTGEIVSGVSQFATGYILPGGVATKLGVLAQAGTGAKLAMTTVAGMVTDATAFSPESPLLIETIKELGGPDLTGLLGEDPTDAERRLARALEGAVGGIAVEGVLAAAGRAWLRSARGEITPAQAQKEVLDAIETAPAEVGGKALSPDDIGKIDAAVAATTPAEKPFAEKPPLKDATRRPLVNGKPRIRLKLEERITSKIDGGPTDELARVSQRLNRPKVPKGIKQTRALVKEVRKRLDAHIGDPEVNLSAHARETIQEHRTIFGEARTDAALVDSARPHLRFIMDGVRSGDFDRVAAYATDAATPAAFTDKAFAFQSATRTLRGAMEKARGDLMALKDKPVPPEVVVGAREAFDELLEAYLKLETINTNIGSWWGAFGRQRQSARQALEASDIEMLGKKAPLTREQATAANKAAADEELAQFQKMVQSAKDEMAQENYYWEWYKKLRNGGADPESAWGFIEDQIAMGRAAGVPPHARAKPPGPEEPRGRVQKFVDGYVEMSYDFMLSGLDTHLVNWMTTTARTVQFILSEAATGVIRNDRVMQRQVSDRVAGMVGGMRENARWSLEAFKPSRTVLSEPLDALQGGVGEADKWGMKGWPAKAALRLMAATDQWFSGNWYRGEIAVKAGREADLMGLKGAPRKTYIDQEVRKAFDPDGRGIDLLAIHQSRQITFQQPFNRKSPYAAERFIAARVDFINHKNPYIRAFLNMQLPFVRIFFALTDQGIRLTPGLREAIQVGKYALTGHNTKWWDDLMGNNGTEAMARAYGEFMLGWGIVGSTIAGVVSGNITGGNPGTWVMDATSGDVAPEYSIRIGDKWVPYGRYEPFAFPLKIVANTYESLMLQADARERGDIKTWADEATGALMGAAFVLGETFASNPFAQSIEDLTNFAKAMAEPEQFGNAWEKYMQGQVDRLVPNLVRKTNEMVEGGHSFTGDTLWERFARNFTMFSSDKFDLDVRRNPVTGEPIVKRTPGTSIFPTEASSYGDPVSEMLWEAYQATGKTYELKGSTGWPGIKPKTDLKTVPTDDGSRSLYDLYLGTVASIKIDGKTYREALMELAENPEYRALPWGNRTRVRETSKGALLNSVKKRYEDAATEVVKNTDAWKKLAREQLLAEHLFSF